MKKIAALVLCIVLAFTLTACSPSRADLSKYTTAELRDLIVATFHESANRFPKALPSISQNFLKVMHDNGYEVEQNEIHDQSVTFYDPSNSNFKMEAYADAGLDISIPWNVDNETAVAWIAGLILAVWKAEHYSYDNSKLSYMVSRVKDYLWYDSMEPNSEYTYRWEECYFFSFRHDDKTGILVVHIE